MNLNNMKIGSRLALGFGLLVALMIGMATLSFERLSKTKDGMTSVVVYQHRSDLAHTWVGNSQLNAARTLAIAKASNSQEMQSYFLPLIKATAEENTAAQKELESLIKNPKAKEMLKTLGEQRVTYNEARDKMYAALKNPDRTELEAVIKDKLQPSAEAYLGTLSQLKAFEDHLADERIAEVAAEVHTTQMTLITLAALSLVAGVLGAIVITRSVTRPLMEAVSAAQVIAGKDLSQRLDSARKDELGDLLRALGAMQSSLHSMVSQVRSSTDSISTASTQIASGNQDLSTRTEQTASNLQEAASSMEELTGTVKQSADSARQANQLAASAANVAARGGDVVSKVVSTMDDINNSSKKIADIIGVIDGIAFQTNILALNAAVEAARAGEQGRGFAVVAGEVRSLAQRSAQAAKEIKELIGASVEKVDSGSKLVADAGKTMQEIVSSVQRVTDIIGEITAAAAEQSDGIGQVSTSVSELDRMTQQNAALVEESAAAAESLREQALRLTQVVGTFRIDAHSSQSAPAATPAAATRTAPTQAGKTSAAPGKASTPASAHPTRAAAPARAAPVALAAAAPTAAAPKASPAGTTAPDDDWETF